MREVLLEPMLDDAIAKSKAHRFTSQNEAHWFMRVCLKVALERCNVFCPPKSPNEIERQKALNQLCTANNVRIERNRQMLRGEWWNAIYVFKAGELVAFIAEPQERKPAPTATDKYPAWTVRTNVKL